MAATNLRTLNSGDKTYLHADVIGTGAIASSDVLVTDTVTYPAGSRYHDKTNHIDYYREGVAKVIGDWVKSAASTVAT